VLGDHQADFAVFFVRFVSGVNDFDAMFGIEVPRVLVEHVGKIAE